MVIAYALEHRHRAFIALFASACAGSSAYGFLIGSLPFGIVEAVWSAVAMQRFRAAARHRPVSGRDDSGETRADRACDEEHGEVLGQQCRRKGSEAGAAECSRREQSRAQSPSLRCGFGGPALER